MVMRNFNATQQTRSGTLTEVFEDIELTTDGFRSISKTVIPYARSKTITFTANSLKPFSKLYVLFDKRNVNAYVTPAASGAVGTTYSNFSDVVSPVAGSTLISDGVGNCEGTFTIPNPRISGNPQFPTGDITFVIQSDPNNRQVGDASSELVSRETSAEAIYSAKGILDTQQETIISTRNAIIRTTAHSQDSGIIVGAAQEVIRPEPVDFGGDGDDGSGDDGDPLGQTFVVVGPEGGPGDGGVFLTSCDIFFFAKDETYPVMLEIRNVINGFPGSKILPFGRKTLQTGEIITSTDGTVATTFTFDSPVYVQGGAEYCITLSTSTSDYKVWIADLGTQDTSGNEITKQPHAGILFKSSNGHTWTPSQTQDMKFSMKRAKFDTTAAGIVTLQNQTLPAKTLRVNPLEMLDASTNLKINHPGHGMYSTLNNVIISEVKSGATTTLAGAISDTATSITLTSGTNFDDTSGKYSRDASNVYLIKIGDEIISYTDISGTAITGATRAANSTTAVSHVNGATVELYQIHKVPLSDINKTHTALTNIEQNSYTIVLATTPVVDGAGSTSTFGGSVVTATENAQYDVSTTNIGLLVPSNTKVDAGFLSTTGTSPNGVETSFTKSTTRRTLPLQDNYYWGETNLVASGINETNEMSGIKSLSVPLILSTDFDSLSPVIDTQRLSMVAVANQINVINSSSDVYPTSIYKTMTEPTGDNHSAIYLTKKINLETPATSLRVLLDAARTSDASIKILFKILRVDDAFDFDEMSFKFFNDDGTVTGSGGPDITTRPSVAPNEYIENEYTAGVTDDGIGSPLEEFISFQIKIVMRTINQARPPLLKNLRVLALAT